MKRYQIALIFFALGIFAVTSVAVYFGDNRSGEAVDTNSLRQYEYNTVRVYFSNYLMNPDSVDCSKTVPLDRAVSRLSDNSKSGLAEYSYLSLSELLKGPAENEKVRGYVTSINEGVKIHTIIVESGIATVDFNERLNEGVAGSCRVEAIRSQISNTLKQFPEITEVIITVNGESEGILEP